MEMLVTAREFANMHGLSVGAVYAIKKCLVSRNKQKYVDLECIRKRQDFIKKVWNKAHDNYFKLAEKMSDYKQAKLLSKYYHAYWESFLGRQLFSYSMLDFQQKPLLLDVPTLLWVYFRLSTKLLKELENGTYTT